MYWQGEFVYQSRGFQLVIISFILKTLMFDSGVILKGEIRCQSLSVINNGNWTEWSAIWAEIIRVISKLNKRAAVDTLLT